MIIRLLVFVNLMCFERRGIELFHDDLEVTIRIPFELDGPFMEECYHFSSAGEDYCLYLIQICFKLIISNSSLNLEHCQDLETSID